MKKNSSYTEEALEWYEHMNDAYRNRLTDEEKQDLLEWDNQISGDGSKATSDWPGWEKYIGLPPWKRSAN